MTNHLLEEEVTINGEHPLKGILTLPKESEKPVPAIIMLHGSGPTDRNENVKDMRINTFKELTEAIVPLGIATLRYDKRGVGESGGDYLSTGMWDLVDDAIHAIEYLESQTAIDSNQIFLLGHSEGSILAPAISVRKKVKGLILIAGIAESLKETVMQQADTMFKELENMAGFKGKLLRFLKIPNKLRKQQTRLYEKVENTEEDVIKVQLQKINAKWMREHFAYNVADDLRKVKAPTLVITGAEDIQVKPEQAKQIADLVQGESEYHVIDNLSHILRKQSDAVTMLHMKKEYAKQLLQPIDSELTDVITNWLKRQTK